MKKIYIASTLLAAMIFTSTTAFAAGNINSAVTSNKNCIKHTTQLPENFEKMPLSDKKNWLITKYSEKVNEKIKEGKITKEQGDLLIKDMNDKINQWDGKTPFPFSRGMSNKIKLPDNFDKMTLEEKKNWLITNYTEKVNQKVSDGKITKEKGNELIAKMKEKINNWNGNAPLNNSNTEHKTD